MVSSVLLVVGALLVGDAIHGSIVTGTHAVTGPWVVLRLGLGLVLIALGYRFQTPTSEYVAMPSGEPDRPDEETDDAATETGEFDSAMSPLGDDGLEHVDGDRETDAEE